MLNAVFSAIECRMLKVRSEFAHLSWSDLIAFAGHVALEEQGEGFVRVIRVAFAGHVVRNCEQKQTAEGEGPEMHTLHTFRTHNARTPAGVLKCAMCNVCVFPRAVVTSASVRAQFPQEWLACPSARAAPTPSTGPPAQLSRRARSPYDIRSEYP
jgi:hypothetical protein